MLGQAAEAGKGQEAHEDDGAGERTAGGFHGSTQSEVGGWLVNTLLTSFEFSREKWTTPRMRSRTIMFLDTEPDALGALCS